MRIAFILFAIFVISTTFIPFTREYALRKFIENKLATFIPSTHTFSTTSINFWDFSIHMDDLRILNPTPFPKDFVIRIGHIQIKPTWKIFRPMFDTLLVDNLTFNLYHVPDHGTNIGIILNHLNNTLRHHPIRTQFKDIRIHGITVNLTQHLEPITYSISELLTFQTQQEKENLDFLNFINQIIQKSFIESHLIPEEVKRILIKELENNTIYITHTE